MVETIKNCPDLLIEIFKHTSGKTLIHGSMMSKDTKILFKDIVKKDSVLFYRQDLINRILDFEENRLLWSAIRRVFEIYNILTFIVARKIILAVPEMLPFKNALLNKIVFLSHDPRFCWRRLRCYYYLLI